MKLQILFFILYIHYSVSQNLDEDKKNGKSYPKKVRPGFIQFHDAGKYVKPLAVPTKKAGNLRDYTAFPKPYPHINEEQASHQIVPDSPFFPLDNPIPEERRTRVKKVLSTYVTEYPLRQKRSADDKKDYPVKSKVSSRLSSKTKGGSKKLNAKLSGKKEGGVQRSKDPLKQYSKNESPAKKLAVKKGSAHRVGHKKRDLTNANRTPSHAGNHKHRLSNNQKYKLSQPAAERAKKLKSTNKKRLEPKDSIQKKLKTSRSKAVVKNLKSGSQTSQKKSQSQRIPNTKNRGGSSRKDPEARRLIAGRDALIEQYPYVVSIQKDNQHWCSGAILNPRLVITTANCLWKSSSISRMRVRAGSRHPDRGGQVAKIQEVMKHPAWKVRRNPDNDVALMLLDRNIRFSHVLHGVDLPNRVMMPPFDDVWITSWGSERRDGIYDGKGITLQVYHARIMERDKCNNVTQRFGVTVTDNFICLAQTGRRAPCTRDTGAPAVSDGVLWGLASWGIRKLCGTERFPAMFSYIASQGNMDFIINATHLLMADERNDPFLDRYPVVRFPVTTPTPITLPY